MRQPSAHRFVAASLCSLAGALFASPLAADQYHGINAGAPIWGGAISFSPTKAGSIAATGCRGVRINFRLDGHAGWDAGLLSAYDTIIQNALDRNLVVLGLLSNECMPVGQPSWNDDADGDGMNAYVAGFSETARLLITRYRDRIKRWEVWNEPNAWTNANYAEDPRNAGGTYILPRVYANLLAESWKELNHDAGRSVLTDHGIALVSGGLFAHEIGGSFSHAMDYMEQVYAQNAAWDAFEALAGRRYPWTIFGYHFYLATDTTITTSRLNQYFSRARNVQAANGDPSPIFVTEFGWNSASGVGESGQAGNMRIAYDWMETRPYIVGTYWYQWTDEPYPWLWGITRADGSHKPSYTEFAAQQADNLPPPEPQVTLVADRTVIETGQQVRFTPTVSTFPQTTAVASTWHIGEEILSVEGPPAPLERTFAQPGSYAVWLAVRDSNTLSGGSNVLQITVKAPETSPADFDGDGDVDQTDFAHLQVCFSGGGFVQDAANCRNARLDADSDVDTDDFDIFQLCMTGPGIAADPGCGRLAP